VHVAQQAKVRPGVEGRIRHTHLGHAHGDTGESVSADVEELLHASIIPWGPRPSYRRAIVVVTGR
jgi:hypothetical protein